MPLPSFGFRVCRGGIVALFFFASAVAMGQVVFTGPNPWVDLTGYGAIGDGKINSSAGISAKTVTLNSAATQWGFAASDVNKYLSFAPGSPSPLGVPSLGAATLTGTGYLGTGQQTVGSHKFNLICVEVEAIQDNGDLPVTGAVDTRSTPSNEVCTQVDGTNNMANALQFAVPGNLGSATGYRVLAAPEGQLTSITSGTGGTCTTGTYVMDVSASAPTTSVGGHLGLGSSTDFGQGAVIQITVTAGAIASYIILAPGFGYTDATITPTTGSLTFPFCSPQPATLPTFHFAGNGHERIQIQQTALQDFVVCASQSATNFNDNACDTGTGHGFTLFRYTSTGGLSTTTGVFLTRITGFTSATVVTVADSIPVASTMNGPVAWGTDNSGAVNAAVSAIAASIANTTVVAPRGVRICFPAVGAVSAPTGRYYAIGGFRLPFSVTTVQAVGLGYDLTTCGGSSRDFIPTGASSGYGGGGGTAVLGSLGSDWAVNVGFWAAPTSTNTNVSVSGDGTTAVFNTAGGSPTTFANACIKGAQVAVSGCTNGGFNLLTPTQTISSDWASGTITIKTLNSTNGSGLGCKVVCGVPTSGGAVRGVSVHDIAVEDPLLTSSYGGVLLQGNWSGANLQSDNLKVNNVDASNFANGFCFAAIGIQVADFYRNAGSCVGAYFWMDDVSDVTVEGGRYAFAGNSVGPVSNTSGYGYAIWAYNNPISQTGAAPGNNRFLDVRGIDFYAAHARFSTQQASSIGNFGKQENIGLSGFGGAGVACGPGTACAGTTFIVDDPTLGLNGGCKTVMISNYQVGRIGSLYQFGTGCSGIDFDTVSSQQAASQTQPTSGQCGGTNCQFLGLDNGVNTQNCVGNQAIGIGANCIYNNGFTSDAGTIQCAGADCNATTLTGLTNIFTGASNQIPVPVGKSSFLCEITYQQAISLTADTIAIQSASVGPANLRGTALITTAASPPTFVGPLDSGNITSTTATAFGTTFTPGAANTSYTIRITGTIETNASGSKLTFLWSVG